MPVRVVVCEDQALVRAGLISMLRTDPDFEVVGEAGDGAEALALIQRVEPDVALVDIQMPELDGLQVTEQVARELPEVRVVVLTTFGLDEYVSRALRAGAAAFLLKDSRPEDLLDAVHAVAAGEARLDPAVLPGVFAHFRRHVAQPAPTDAVDALTAREREVLQLLARGMSNAEIAAHLVVAPGTVKAHVASILAKLGVRGRAQAIVVAFESGLAGP